MVLSLFYSEPDPDRWLPFDRYPRAVIRRIFRGAPLPGGQRMVFINLARGLTRLGVEYRVNDYRHAGRNPKELVGIIGKPHVLLERQWKNPVLFGASIFSHPLAAPDLFENHPVVRVLVPGAWMKEMFTPYYGERVEAWPVGIDTDEWRPSPVPKDVDLLVYDKVRWEHDAFQETLIAPILREIEKSGASYEVLRYGHYLPPQLKEALIRCRAAIFLCEHETQGLAYQQMLASGVPVFAWDRGGYWQDPEFFPHRVKFGPVTSVPYWDERCGMKFRDADEFSVRFGNFLEVVRSGMFSPRDYILEHLTLEKCAQAYLDQVEELTQ